MTPAIVITVSVILHLLAVLAALLMHTPEIEVRATHLTPEDFARADDIKFVCDWYHEPITVGGNLNGTHVSHGMCVSCKNKFLDGQPLPNKTTVNQF